MKVDTKHPIYNELQPKREVFRAVKGGTDTMQGAKEKFLPKYPSESSDDYAARLKSSTIDGIVAMGVDTLCGKVFDEEIDTSKVTLDKSWLENFDNEGTHFNSFAREVFEHSFDGFCLILADMPTETLEAKELKRTFGAEADKMLNVRPYCRYYTASNVINWQYAVNPQTQIKKLVLLVLQETSDEIKDRFERETIVRYRVYSMEAGAVRWELWREETKDNKTEFILEGEGIISNVREIPCASVGKFTDEPKLLNEARLEIKAHQKESSFDTIEYLSVPTFYTKGYEGEESLMLGASAHLKLPIAGEVGFAQIDAAGHESLKGSIASIKDVIKQRISAVAETSQRVVEKTASETIIENKDKHARLVVWADELKDALERSLQFMAQMAGMGEDAGGEIKLKTSWSNAPAPAIMPPSDGKKDE